LANPLAGKSHEELEADATKFANDVGLSEHVEYLKKGAVIAQDPSSAHAIPY
jgi:hypothetical protein